jgi:hypothetical protein
MKKIIVISILVLITVIIAFFICYRIETLNYNPLQEKDIRKLFFSSESVKKKCSVDYVGLSIHGEIFEIYLYKTKDALLDLDYPKYENEWENQQITNKTIISKWKHCPLDSASRKLCEFILNTNQFDKKKCVAPFHIELNNSNNYYSYVDFSDGEQYFLLFCPKTEHLYYIRMRF